jgi:hypothetical protein
MLFEFHSDSVDMIVFLLQADPSLVPEVEEDVMAECTKIGPIDRLRVSMYERISCRISTYVHAAASLSTHTYIFIFGI